MIYISTFGMVNALGNSLDEIANHLTRQISPGMQQCAGWMQDDRIVTLGQVAKPLPLIPDALSEHRSRNNQLLLAALEPIRPTIEQAISRFGADRVAVILGTSTSGSAEGDQFVNATLHNIPTPEYHYFQQELGDPSRFLAQYLNLTGPAFTLSTACSSSARALITGRRLIEADLADVAIVGGADSLSRMPINGFDSLEAFSCELCRPFAENRCGITIGEGAALMLLTREPQPLAILGVGESSDAWHISAPHPQGEGAIRAIQQALQDANLCEQDIGYINLHGTATPLNDQIEAQIIHSLFGHRVPCSSTKHLTGHTLGAAGITEAALSALILQRELVLPYHTFEGTRLDPSLPDFGLLLAPNTLAQPTILSSSFAFGGNNTCLILGRVTC